MEVSTNVRILRSQVNIILLAQTQKESSTFSKVAAKKTTPKFMPLTTTVFRIVSLLNVLPFRWDSKAGVFSNKPQGFARSALHSFMLVCVTLDFLFTFARLLQLLILFWPIYRSALLSNAILLFALCGLKLLTMIDTYYPALRRQYMIRFTNQLLQIRRSEGLHRDLTATKVYVFFSSFRIFQMVLACIFKPNRRQFWYSLLDERWKTTLVYWIHLVFNLQTCFGLSISVFFAVNNMVSYTNTLEMLLKKPVRNRDRMDQRLMSYRQLQVFAAYFVGLYGFMLGFTKIYCLTMSIILAFGCIRFFGDLDWRIYLNMPVTLLLTTAFIYVFYNPLSRHGQVSRKAINRRFLGSNLYGLGKPEKIHARICARSCKTICLIGIKRTILASMLKFVIYQAVRLLIITGKR